MDNWPNKILYWVFTTAIILNISFSAWLVKEIVARPTESRVKSMIETKNEVTNIIIESMKDSATEYKRVIQANTDAINALKIEIAKRNK